jgi:nucleoside-diphosphate-sugar epimerase
MGNEDKSTYSGLRVLVTGASGFIGSLLCTRLTSHGASVHAVSRQPRTASRSVVKWYRGDLVDDETVRNLFATIKPDIVFHLASEVTGNRDIKLVLPTLNANLLSSVNILVAATEQRCKRIVMAGSLEEPDEMDNALATPCSPYAAAKWSASAYTRMFHTLYQTPITSARLFMVYGPGQQDLKKLIPYVILSLLRGESPKLSSGTRPVDWIYVGDVVDGLLAMGVTQGIDGSTLDLGSGSLVTTRKVVESLCGIVNAGIQPDFGAIPDRPMERVKKADIARTRQYLGWNPSTSLQQGLEETVAWYRNRLERNEL